MVIERKGRWLSAISATIVALVFAGCSSLSSPTGDTTPDSGTPGAPTPTAGPSISWASIVIDSATSSTGPLQVDNLNPFSGKRAALVSMPTSDGAVVDGVSPNGQTLAYHPSNTRVPASYEILTVADPSTAHVINTSPNAIGKGLWQHDSSHMAVVTSGGVTIFDINGGTPTGYSSIQASALVGFSPDDTTLYFVGASGASGVTSGALYRVTLSDPTKLTQLTPGQVSPHFVLSRDGQKIYYQNAAPGGSFGLYEVTTSSTSVSPTLRRATSGVPVGFNASGAVLYVVGGGGPVALYALGTGDGPDAALVDNIVIGTVTLHDPTTDIVVAPDGSGLVAMASPATNSEQFFFTDLTASTKAPKASLTLTGVSRADVVGWDSATITSGS